MCVAPSVRAVSREKGVRAEVEEWEEPLHPGPVSALYPTFPHNATQLAHFLPRLSTIDHSAAPECRKTQAFLPLRVEGRRPGRPRKAACESPFCTRDCGPQALPSGACALSGARWETRPSTCAGPGPVSYYAWQ